MNRVMLSSSSSSGFGVEAGVAAVVEDRDRSGRVAASEKQGEPNTALNQLSRIQDSDIRQDDSRFHQRQKNGLHILSASAVTGQVGVLQDCIQGSQGRSGGCWASLAAVASRARGTAC